MFADSKSHRQTNEKLKQEPNGKKSQIKQTRARPPAPIRPRFRHDMHADEFNYTIRLEHTVKLHIFSLVLKFGDKLFLFTFPIFAHLVVSLGSYCVFLLLVDSFICSLVNLPLIIRRRHNCFVRFFFYASFILCRVVVAKRLISSSSKYRYFMIHKFLVPFLRLKK